MLPYLAKAQGALKRPGIKGLARYSSREDGAWSNTLEKGHVVVPYAGSVPPFSGSFHPLWLRDHCNCPKCVHPDSKQKLHSSGIVAKMPKERVTVKQHRVANDVLQVQWQDGHESNFPVSWLERRDYGRTARAKRFAERAIKLWNSRDLPIGDLQFSFANVEKGGESLCKLLSTVENYGLAFVHNLPTTPVTNVEILARQIGTIKDTFYGVSWDVKSVPGAKNIAYTSLFLGLHMDLTYFESPPGVQLLHCLSNQAVGGDSIFLDIYKAVQLLNERYPQHYNTLAKVPVTFHYQNDGHHLQLRRPTISVDRYNEGDPYKITYAPPFQGALDNVDAEMVVPFYEAMAAFEDIMQDKENQLVYQTRLEPGTCVLFNNRRVLHGRTGFDAKSGNRHLRGTYVDWDVFRDKLRVLQGQGQPR